MRHNSLPCKPQLHLRPRNSRTDPVLNSCSDPRESELGEEDDITTPSINTPTRPHRHVVPTSLPRSPSCSSSADHCPHCRAQLRRCCDPGQQTPRRCLRSGWHICLCSGTTTLHQPVICNQGYQSDLKLLNWHSRTLWIGRLDYAIALQRLTREPFSTLPPPRPPRSSLPPRHSAPSTTS